MLNQEQAKYLLELKKSFKSKPSVVDLRSDKIRIELVSPDDLEWEFLVDITSSRKKSFKISLHHMETKSKQGILRVDFNSSHRNPETINSFVPKSCHAFVGYWFLDEPHIHIFVEGYRDLAWAIPLASDDRFSVKSIDSSKTFADAIKEFAKLISLTDSLEIQEAIL
jgi:hypothetical protein